jgi:hypothetical protein
MGEALAIPCRRVFDPKKSGFKAKKIVFGTKKIVFATKKMVFVTKKIVFVTKKIVFDAKKIVFVTKKMVFMTKKIVFATKKIVFETKTIYFYKRRMKTAVPTVFPAIETITSTTKAIVFLVKITICGTRTCFQKRNPFSAHLRSSPLLPGRPAAKADGVCAISTNQLKEEISHFLLFLAPEFSCRTLLELLCPVSFFSQAKSGERWENEGERRKSGGEREIREFVKINNPLPAPLCQLSAA